MGKLIFITGGVRSGKSAFAENYVGKLVAQSNQAPIYIATGVAFDEEMQARIARHQQDRLNTGLRWQTYEVPYDLTAYENAFCSEHIILFECITTWLSNIYYEAETEQHAVTERLTQFKKVVTTWRQQGATALLISNEVLDSGVSDFAETAHYQQTLGELHQWLVQICDEAYEVNAQMIERWK